jgi:hypothetical protein
MEKPYVTKTGKILTEEDIEALADEAEQGYDVSRLRERKRRRKMEQHEVIMWALRQNFHADRMNAAIHCAEVRYSPITFRLYECLVDEEGVLREEARGEDLDMLLSLGRQHGVYPEDPGR